MSVKRWEKKVLAKPGARARVAEIEHELRLAAGLTAAREGADLSQRELAKRIGVSQPRIAQIEKVANVTLDVLAQYVEGLGGELEVSMRVGRKVVPLLTGSKRRASSTGKQTPIRRQSRKRTAPVATS